MCLCWLCIGKRALAEDPQENDPLLAIVVTSYRVLEYMPLHEIYFLFYDPGVFV